MSSNFLKKFMKKFVKNKKGFSLIELSIALIIVGVLTLGLMKSQGLIENSKIKSVIMNVENYRMATMLFNDKYHGLPGDIANTSVVGENLKGGNNDGKIGGNGLDPRSEAFNFWQHLAASELITGVRVIKDGESPRFGDSVPASAFGGGFSIEYGKIYDAEDNWIVLGEASEDKGTGGLLTPQQALAIDQKMDNGDPTSGSVRSIGEGCVENGKYNLANKGKVCVMYFRLS